MHRTSTELEYYRDKRLVIDADGVDVEIPADGTVATQPFVEKALEPVTGQYSTTNIAGYHDDSFKNRYLKLNDKGKLSIIISSITDKSDPANKEYVDTTVANSSWYKGGLNSKTSLDTLTDPGYYWQDYGSIATPENSYPEAARGILEVFTHSLTVTQRYTTESGNIWVRPRKKDGTWGTWAKAAPEVAPAPAAPTQPDSGDASLAIEHQIREADMRRRIGRISTGGKAAVTLVFDHGEINFEKIVLPELKKRGFRATLAVNGGRFDSGYVHAATTGDISWDTLKSWSGQGIEIANHSMSHEGATGYDQTVEEVRTSRERIEEALGGAEVYSWVQPNITDSSPRGGMDGFGSGLRKERYWETAAGRLVYGSHAVISGTIYQAAWGWVYPTDGTIPPGIMGQFIDRGGEDVGKVKTAVDRAVTEKGRTVIRSHPSQIGNTNRITVDEFTGLLDYLKEKEDAGELVVLPLCEWSIANLN